MHIINFENAKPAVLAQDYDLPADTKLKKETFMLSFDLQQIEQQLMLNYPAIVVNNTVGKRNYKFTINGYLHG